MHLCQNHWHELKNAIRQRGLWHLVTPSGYNAAHSSAQELKEKQSQAPSDPLLAASLMIYEQARMAFGFSLATAENCPLCEVDRSLGMGAGIVWVDANTDLVLHACREQHLVDREDS